MGKLVEKSNFEEAVSMLQIWSRFFLLQNPSGMVEATPFLTIIKVPEVMCQNVVSPLCAIVVLSLSLFSFSYC